MYLPRDAVAWSVVVTFSRASHVHWDQVSASGLLVVFCVAVIVICLFLAVPWLVTFSCASHDPWDQVSTSGPRVVFCVAEIVICIFLAVPWLVTFSCVSHAPWDQVSPSSPLVVLCCRVAVLYVFSSRCRGLVCDCGIFLCLSCPLG